MDGKSSFFHSVKNGLVPCIVMNCWQCSPGNLVETQKHQNWLLLQTNAICEDQKH
jgi:hypothetical protein